MTININVSGASGKNAIRGKNGLNGRSPGDCAQTGRDGGMISVHLHVVGRPTAPYDNGGTNDEAGLNKYQLQVTGMRNMDLSSPEEIVLAPRGGRGGNGGIGGDEGNGAKGEEGKNANRWRSGQNGGPGGSGGDAGIGTSGGNGGNSGTVDIQVNDHDSYLLVTTPSCATLSDANSVVQGGLGGDPGEHGTPGLAGEGGKGGSSYSYTTTTGSGDNQTTTRRHYNPGGHRGPNGAPGRRKSNCILQPGSPGSTGRFTIRVQDKQYKNRYDLVLQKASFGSKEMLHSSNPVIQFGDCVSISNMTCRIIGGKISPSQNTRVDIRDPSHNSHILVCKNNIDTNSKVAAYIQERVQQGDSGAISGAILFRVKAPDIGHLPLDDMPPFRAEERLYLQATQLGPKGYGFELRQF